MPKLMLPRLWFIHRSSKLSWATFHFWFCCASSHWTFRSLSSRVSRSTWLSQVWIVATHSNPLCLPAHISAIKPRREMFRCTWSTFKRPSRDIQIQLQASRRLNLNLRTQTRTLVNTDGGSHDDGHQRSSYRCHNSLILSTMFLIILAFLE